jgi:hypothetical protein
VRDYIPPIAKNAMNGAPGLFVRDEIDFGTDARCALMAGCESRDDGRFFV